MKLISKEEMFSQLVDSINLWLTDCLYLCNANTRGKYKIQGVKDQIWKLIDSYTDVARSLYGEDRDRETERTAFEIIEVLNLTIEDFIRKNNSDNYFMIDLSVHKKEIVEKLRYIRL